MRKRKDGQAPSVSVDVEERTPSSAQVSTLVEEEERAPFIKGGEGNSKCVRPSCGGALLPLEPLAPHVMRNFPPHISITKMRLMLKARIDLSFHVGRVGRNVQSP